MVHLIENEENEKDGDSSNVIGTFLSICSLGVKIIFSKEKIFMCDGQIHDHYVKDFFYFLIYFIIIIIIIIIFFFFFFFLTYVVTGM